MRSCRRFCDWAEDEDIDIFPSHRLDRAIAIYMDRLCYDDEIGVGKGKNLASGMAAMYPGVRLLESYRALKFWEGLCPGVQGSPLAVPVLMEVIDKLSTYGDDGATASDAASSPSTATSESRTGS